MALTLLKHVGYITFNVYFRPKCWTLQLVICDARVNGLLNCRPLILASLFFLSSKIRPHLRVMSYTPSTESADSELSALSSKHIWCLSLNWAQICSVKKSISPCAIAHSSLPAAWSLDSINIGARPQDTICRQWNSCFKAPDCFCMHLLPIYRSHCRAPQLHAPLSTFLCCCLKLLSRFSSVIYITVPVGFLTQRCLSLTL